MARLFLILVKKFGYAAARKMAPKYGISQRVVNKTMKDVGLRSQLRGADNLGTTMGIRPEDVMDTARIGRDQLMRMGRRGLRRTGPPQAPGRGLKNIDKIIADAKKVGTSPAGIVKDKMFSTEGWKGIKRMIDEEELL
tara:strand:+ start:336 stop:749 length:414 start_codon:yes stop_codon:yes gene_type:complete